ncbi:non-ribosomal peptide synthetase [Labedaea rhizosphaerae]|uniref:Amino acid adenylation domain-containing protein n=1 Tax=Labedaea rhizosphaerae TaxID=598644 RepID=A0A4V3D092_LABRH|nr:non-ribosomal peptide synthetase [Labedaea rhizosphaerae]TDQ04935.1 amino acid adenylation domain-containing protein [Labedaea rhizosphaerae]
MDERVLSLPELFAARLGCADAPAVIAGEECLTFGELDRRSNQVAAYLAGRGAAAEVVVGISLPRSVDFVVAVLGVLKSGAAFLPIDPLEPLERKRFIVEDAHVLLTLTEERLRCDESIIDSFPADAPAHHPDPDSLAYVIYTSGSTGTPKGVMVQHASVVNYLTWAAEHYGGAEGGAVLQSPLNTDLGITSLFVPLLTGRPVHVLPGAESLIDELPMALARGGLGFVKLTPAHLDLLSAALDPATAGGAARLLIGGEALRFAQLDLWRTASPDTVIVNEYGPTEATVACCANEFPAATGGDGPVPIGHAIAGATLRVLDEQLRPVPDGEVGELYVGGPPVSRGYLHRPAMTAAAFLPDPGSDGGRVYRTGDLVRRDGGGMLVYVGRTDDQVKLGGHRIELGEVETVMRGIEGVRAVTVALRAPGTSAAALTAFVQLDDGVDTDGVLRVLRERLPDYMVPAEVHAVDTFPLTTQGKVNRTLLLESLDGTADTDLERDVSEIVGDLVAIKSVDVGESFFAMGGDSALAARLVTRLGRAYQVDVPDAVWLQRPSVAGFAELIRTYRRHGRDAALSLVGQS